MTKKKLNDTNAFKELFLYAVKLGRISSEHKTRTINKIKSDLKEKYIGFPENIIKRKMSEKLNQFARELLDKGLLGLNLTDKKNFIKNYEMTFELKSEIINSKTDDNDEEYQKLEMHDHAAIYDNLLVNVEYREAFGDLKEYERLAQNQSYDYLLKYKDAGIKNQADFERMLDMKGASVLDTINNKYEDAMKESSSYTNKFKKIINT